MRSQIDGFLAWDTGGIADAVRRDCCGQGDRAMDPDTEGDGRRGGEGGRSAEPRSLPFLNLVSTLSASFKFKKVDARGTVRPVEHTVTASCSAGVAELP